MILSFSSLNVAKIIASGIGYGSKKKTFFQHYSTFVVMSMMMNDQSNA